MSQTFRERRDFPVPMRWLHAGSDLSRPDHGDQRSRAPVDAFRALAEMPITRFPISPVQIRPPSCGVASTIELGATSNPHSTRCPAGAQLPATSCLGAFWTPASSAAESLVMPASKNQHTTGLMHRSKQHRYSRQLRLARDERLPSHSITSLAVANNVGGKSSPSDLAVARLSTKSNFVIW